MRLCLENLYALLLLLFFTNGWKKFSNFDLENLEDLESSEFSHK